MPAVSVRLSHLEFSLFELQSDEWESKGWPRGTFFKIADVLPIETGDLVLAAMNSRIIVGRWFPNVAGHCWLVRPNGIIRMSEHSPIEIVGVLMPMPCFTSAQ